MSRPYKIKRTKYTGPIKSRPHPLFVALIVLAVLGLGYLGFLSYEPIYNAVMNRDKPHSPSSQPSVPPQPAETSAPQQPEEAPPLTPEPASAAKLQAVYLPPALIGNPTALDAFLEGLKATSLNSVMVDLKDKSGRVLFASQNNQALEWQAVAADAPDLSAFARRLKEQGLFLMVRISGFQDETAARGNKELAVNYRAPGTLWLDNFQNQGGKPWLNPYTPGARQYLLELALEAADCGAALVVLDDLCFPPNSLTGDAYFGETGGLSRGEVLAKFSGQVQEALSKQGARSAVYLTAATLAGEPNPTLYGGPAAEIAADQVLLEALPYQFFDGYTTPKFTLRRPLENPADTVKEVVGFARLELGDREIIPLIQGGGEPSGVVYTPEEIAQQVKTLKDLGLEEYVLYCSDYTAYLLPPK